ncbi:Biotin carboxylase C-terminal domain-containing protein [Epsilonproteobacteria bacterium SCGC AD-308-P11]|jgi:pyruvate carboxylase subunit A|nr:Biotin carboxylase C-terminal domain-containing protein [Epsilonproteobacteria bacterium SCGC AD-308-P11]SMP87466.1 Biotin carboxylase C-terminal domain-containing protein [Epsilonproteobacteria bacterium SCGC AD-308-E02]
MHIEGITTNIPLHREIVRDADFISGKFNTGYLDKKMPIFNLHAVSSIADEEKKIALLTDMIKKIKEHKITTRS